MPNSSLNAKDLVGFLRRLHPAKEWAFLDELRIGTGFGPEGEGRIDAWALNLWPSKKHQRISYEVKISRADFLHELKHPEKRSAALWLSNQFYFVTPAGLVRPEEVPPEAGLLEFDDGGAGLYVRKAPWRETPDPNWRFLSSIARRTQDPDTKALGTKARLERFLADLDDCQWEMDRDIRLGERFEEMCNAYFGSDPMLANIHDLPRFLDDNPARTELIDEILMLMLRGLRLKVDLPRRTLVLSRNKRSKGFSA